VKIKEILQALIEKSDLENTKISEEKKTGGLSKLVGSNKKMMGLGWKPEYSLNKIISDFI
jgi:nucleoside-diphosphate-sugar epimerase